MATEIDEEPLQTTRHDVTTDNSWSLTTSTNRFKPPIITRTLQPTYRFYSGEQLHFLVEYISSTDQCRSEWQIQCTNDPAPRPIEDGFVVNADCSSILIIESITSKLQGLYTFYVENIYGRSTTQAMVTISAKDMDDTKQGKVFFLSTKLILICVHQL